MKYSAAEKAIAQIEGRRAFQTSVRNAIENGLSVDDIDRNIEAMNQAINEIRSVMPTPVTSTTPKKPRAARKPRKGAAE